MTNDTINCIMERRSIRKYLPDMLKNDELQAILNCGLWAPSASDAQNWHITVIRDKAIMDRINADLKKYAAEHIDESKYAKRIINPDFDVFYNPPILLLVSYHDDGKSVWGPTNASLLVQNICIAAQSLGIGTLQVGMTYSMMQSEEYGKPICEELNVPEGYKPHLFISMGYPDTTLRSVKKPRKEGTVNFK